MTTTYAVGRTNLVPNPNGTTVTGWGVTAGGGAASSSALTGVVDSALPAGLTTAVRQTWTTAASSGNGVGVYVGPSTAWEAAVTPGAAYTGSLYVRSSRAQTVAPSLSWYAADGVTAVGTAATGTAVALRAGAFTRLSVTGVAPTGAVYARVRAYTTAAGTAPAVGDTWDATGALVEAGSVLGAYFDGNSTTGLEPATDYAWTGTTGASTSVYQVQQTAPAMLAGASTGKTGFLKLGAALWGLGNFDAPDVIFNGIDSAGVTWALNTVQGWKKTTGEVPLQRAPGADGGWFGPGTRAPRVLTLTGAFRADTAAKLAAAEDQLRAAVEHVAEDTLLWVDGTLRQQQMSVRLTGDLDVDDTNPWFRTWSAVMTAADPYKYAAGGAGLVTVAVSMAQLTGLTGAQFPAQFPLDFGGGTAAAGRVSLVNPGNVTAWPVVSFTTPTGTLDTPALKHVGLQQTEGVSGVLQAGDVAVLDSAAQSVLINGQSAYARRMPGCVFFPLPKGQSDLFFSAKAYNAAATATITYRPRWS